MACVGVSGPVRINVMRFGLRESLEAFADRCYSGRVDDARRTWRLEGLCILNGLREYAVSVYETVPRPGPGPRIAPGVAVRCGPLPAEVLSDDGEGYDDDTEESEVTDE